MATLHRVHIAAAAPAGSVLQENSEGRDSLQFQFLLLLVMLLYSHRFVWHADA